ncbi:MAG: Lrp/AsnC family transcriptional regulator [Gallionellaceae bacterium]|nr:Lrp/AsnC family transcriptional regulator [Gallionellaceae bacterium]
MSELNAFEFHLLNDWQRGFPLVARPYGELASRLGVSELAVRDTLAELKARGHISRIGAVFRPHVLGWSTLAALACPAERIDEVASLIDAYPEVNHNYEREHRYNLWFVLTAPNERRVAEVLAELHRRTGLRPLDLPMLADYHIDLGFDMAAGQAAAAGGRRPRPHQDPAGAPHDLAALRGRLESADFGLAAALDGGLDLTSRPYAALADRCGLSEEAALAGLERLLGLTVIRRFGVVVRHRELGYTANAMVVWDIPEHRVDAAGRALAGQDSVTLCYRRPRLLPDWPYNLFAMVHGRDRAAVLAEVLRLRAQLGADVEACQPLFSRRRFKQCGARYAALARAA